MTADQVRLLKEATLEVLADVGVVFPSKRALELLAGHGAAVDAASGRVRLPADLVARALASAPRSFLLAGREERFDLRLDGATTHVCTEGVGTRVVDPRTGETRASRKEDVAMMARVVDALPLIGFFWPPVSAQDFPASAPLHECHAGLTNTLKHVRGGTTMHPLLARAAVELATVVAGSAEMRRRRPPICANVCTVSPLSHDPMGLEAAFIFAEAGIPLSFMAMPTAGTTAPASLPGALVVGEAEVVSGLVLMQLAQPGCPVFHSNYLSMMDPRSGGYLSEVPLRFEPVVSQLAHQAWGVPDLGGASLSSDASELDWTCGERAGMGAALVPTDSADICGYLGGLAAGATLLYPELVVLQHEALLTAYAWAAELRLGRTDLALDVVADVGPGGHFLGHRHTREHAHRLPLSLRQRARRGVGERTEVAPGGSRAPRSGARAAARAEFLRLAEDHEPAALPDEVLAELGAIVTAADRQARELPG